MCYDVIYLKPADRVAYAAAYYTPLDVLCRSRAKYNYKGYKHIDTEHKMSPWTIGKHEVMLVMSDTSACRQEVALKIKHVCAWLVTFAIPRYLVGRVKLLDLVIKDHI